MHSHKRRDRVSFRNDIYYPFGPFASISKFSIVSNHSEGVSELNAFDNALFYAGIGNLNLVKISSIIPPKCIFFKDFSIKAGYLVPTAYSYIASNNHNEIISSAIAVGIPKDHMNNAGLIMEFSSHCDKIESEKQVKIMIKEGMKLRNLEIDYIMVSSVEHRIQNIGAAFSAVILWG